MASTTNPILEAQTNRNTEQVTPGPGMEATVNEPLKDFTSSARIAEMGERLYTERHKERLEREIPGQYVAIDVLTGEAYIGPYPEDALAAAKSKAPTGLFHLIRVGSTGAYRVSHLLSGHDLAR